MSPRYIVYLTLLVVLVLYSALSYRSIGSRTKMMYYLLVIVLISEIISRVLVVNIKTSLPVYHFLIPIQSIMYGLIYAHKRNSKNIIYMVFGIIALLCAINTTFIQVITDFPTYSLILLSIGLTLFALLDFKRMILVPTSIKLYSLPDFWFNLGTLLFFSMSFFVFGFLNEGLKIFPSIQLLFIFILNIFMYSCYGLSIYLDARKSSKHAT